MGVGVDRNGGSTVRAWACCDHKGCGATFCATAPEVQAVVRVVYGGSDAGWDIDPLNVRCPKHREAPCAP
jgi:hypothetical protein